MATTIKRPRKTRIQKLLKKAGAGKTKNPSAFFGKLKDEVDDYPFKRSSEMSGDNFLVDTSRDHRSRPTG